jgi:hypothetical protein
LPEAAAKNRTWKQQETARNKNKCRKKERGEDEARGNKGTQLRINKLYN